MKRILLLMALMICVSAAFAQKGKVLSAQSFKDQSKLKEALEAINIAIDTSNPKSEKTIPWSKTWEVRGQIYQAIYQSKDENVKKLADNSLAISLESYAKALELDEKKRNEGAIKISLTLLTSDFTDQAVKAFNDNDYELALESFKHILAIEEMPIMIEEGSEATVDTVIIYNAGLAAYNAEKYDEAIKYYKEAAVYGYNGARTYELMAQTYLDKPDTTGAIGILKEGFEKYPENSSIMVQLINIYLNTSVDDAMKYLTLAIENDPENATYHFAKGSLYDKLEKTENALVCYKKAVELKDDYYDAYYNLGTIYYNLGVQQVDVANAVPTNQPDVYDEEIAKADVEFKQAIPYMEKASEINPDDIFSLEALKTLYYRLKVMDKYDNVMKRLSELNQ